MIITLRGLRIYQLYESLQEKPAADNAWAVLEEFCRMAREEDIHEELYTLLQAAVTSEELKASESRRSAFFLYESIVVLLKAVYVLYEERMIGREG